jgi:hypothetical protein
MEKGEPGAKGIEGRMTNLFGGEVPNEYKTRGKFLPRHYPVCLCGP